MLPVLTLVEFESALRVFADVSLCDTHIRRKAVCTSGISDSLFCRNGLAVHGLRRDVDNRVKGFNISDETRLWCKRKMVNTVNLYATLKEHYNSRVISLL